MVVKWVQITSSESAARAKNGTSNKGCVSDRTTTGLGLLWWATSSSAMDGARVSAGSKGKGGTKGGTFVQNVHSVVSRYERSARTSRLFRLFGSMDAK